MLLRVGTRWGFRDDKTSAFSLPGFGGTRVGRFKSLSVVRGGVGAVELGRDVEPERPGNQN